MLHFLYCIYQILVFIPLLILSTIITAVTVGIGTAVGDASYWGYYPGKWWAQFILRVLFIPVKVEGRENLVKGQSYVFVSNHQGAFDIFLIFGHLCRNFKWMMKHQLKKIPFVGYACQKSNQIFVDKRGPSKIKQTYDKARDILKHGISVVVFPEGTASAWWCSLREHARSRVTWAHSVAVRSCLPTNCNCPWCHLQSTGRSR